MRASDLLQANCIVWVEGPSDRLYFNRWMELWSEESIREGTHYQCVIYGGRLLAHLSGEISDSDADEAVSILRVNRKAIVLMDSDRDKPGKWLNETKKRIRQEVEDFGGVAWVTKGREIENYLGVQSISQVFPTIIRDVKQYESFPSYLRANSSKEDEKKFLKNKPLFAERVIPHITSEEMNNCLDLGDRIKECVAKISEWNGLSG